MRSVRAHLSDIAAALRRTRHILVLTCRAWGADRASMWAASLAFYSMMSLGPLLLAAAAFGGLWLGEDAAQAALVAQVRDTVGEQAAAAAETLMRTAWRRREGVWATLLGAASLLFGASGVFAALQDAVDAIWHVAPRPSGGVLPLVRRRFVSMAMVAGLGFISAVSCVMSAAVAAAQGRLAAMLPVASGLGLCLGVVMQVSLFALFFAVLYKILPDARLRWREVWSGGLVTAVLFCGGKVGLGFYLARAHVESPFGAAGSLALILIWVYYAAQIFFLGAEWVRADVHSRGRPIEPAAHAVAVETVEVDPRKDQRFCG